MLILVQNIIYNIFDNSLLIKKRMIIHGWLENRERIGQKTLF